jgi:hypothetical protein
MNGTGNEQDISAKSVPANGADRKCLSYMEIIYIDTEDQARKTHLRLSLETDAATWAQFRSYRRYGVNIKHATFLLDYHNRKGDLSDTIALDRYGFEMITGQQPKTDAEYVKLDSDFWNEVRSAA